MCGRYTIVLTEDEFSGLLGFSELPFGWKPRYNIAPGQLVPAIIANQDERRIGQLQWGLIPHWAKDRRKSWINARGETVAELPSFKQSFQRRRCLIPADGFYEWKQVTASGAKQPMRIHLPARKLFMMAGLYDTWVQPDGSRLHTCTIVTTASNRMMMPIHHRMPVILEHSLENAWLDPQLDTAALISLLKPYPSELMDAYPVSDRLGSVEHDSADFIQQVDPKPEEGFLF